MASITQNISYGSCIALWDVILFLFTSVLFCLCVLLFGLVNVKMRDLDKSLIERKLRVDRELARLDAVACGASEPALQPWRRGSTPGARAARESPPEDGAEVLSAVMKTRRAQLWSASQLLDGMIQLPKVPAKLLGVGPRQAPYK